MSASPLREGDVVWAHQRGYPWWPAVVSSSPAASPNQGLWTIGAGKKVKYHCTFLAWNRERSWLEGTAFKKFKREDGGEGRKKEFKVRLKEYRESHLEAIELGLEILDDPNNPMNHLEKKVDELITDDKKEIDGLFVDDSHPKEKLNTKPDVGSVPQKVFSKTPIKKARLPVATKNALKKSADVKEDLSLATKSKSGEGFFQTIAEKVKNPRNRKPVDKFSSLDETTVGKIGKIKKFHQKPPPAATSPVSPSSLSHWSPRHCQCAGCLLADCGQCRFCLDRVCFGGEGKLRQRCSRRMCMGMTVREAGSRLVDEAVGVNLKDKENDLVEEGVGIDIIKVPNKGKRAKIIDIESEAESGEDLEATLVINFDDASGEVNNNTTALSNQVREDLTSPTHGELPTSSSISYTKSDDKNLMVANKSVWDEVKHSLLDVEDSLLRDLDVNDSSDDDLHISIHHSPSSPSCSPPPSDHSQASSSITISTPNQSPVRELFEDPNDLEKVEITEVGGGDLNIMEGEKSNDFATKSVDPLFFHVEDIDDIIEVNILKDDSNVLGEMQSAKESKDVSKVNPEVKSTMISNLKTKKQVASKSSNTAKSKSKSKSGCKIPFEVPTKSDMAAEDPEPEKVVKAKNSKVKEKLRKVTEIDMFTNPDIKKSNKKKHVQNYAENKLKSDAENVSTMEMKSLNNATSKVNAVKELKVTVPSEKTNCLKSDVSAASVLAKDLNKGDSVPIKKNKSKLKEMFLRKSSKTKSVDDDDLENNIKKVKDRKTNKKDDGSKAKKLKDLKSGSLKVHSEESGSKLQLPIVSKLILGSFKIPKSMPKLREATEKLCKEVIVDDKIKTNKTRKDADNDEKIENRKGERNREDERDHSKRSRKELKEDVRKGIVSDDKSSDRKNFNHGKSGKKKVDQIVDPSKKTSGHRSNKSAVNWVAAVDWSDQVAPDSTTTGDEPLKKPYFDKNIVDAGDGSECSSGSRDDEDASWKRKRGRGSEKELGSQKKVKMWIEDQRFSNEPSSCCDPVESSSSSSQPLPSYTMSLKVLDKLGPKSLFDSHCHLDFILFWRVPQMEVVSFEQFLHAYPLMNHSSLEGFITNFCSPKLWKEHLASPTPLMHSLLSRPSVHYTIGCHPHFARELLISGNYRQMEQLIEKAGPACVAVGECGLDTSNKNTMKMTDQVEVFKMQVKLAIRLKKPLVLHIRGAEKEAIRALDEVNLPADWPIHRHCWNDTWSVCQDWLDKYPCSVVGITPLVTFPRTSDLQKVAKMVPMDRLVLETDAPYFLPRGGGADGYLGHTTREFSLPVHVANVAAQVAAIRGCSVDEVLRASRENIARVYSV